MSKISGDASARDETESRTKKGETYARLLQAVVQMVFEQGYAGATMMGIAEQAGVTRGAIQHYFGDRRVDLMTAVCADLLEQRQTRYRASLTALLHSDFDDARTQMKLAYKSPATWFLIEIWIASKSDDGLREKVDEYLHGEHDIDDLLIDSSLSKSFGPALDFMTLKYFLRTLTRGLSLEYSRRPQADLFDNVVDLAFDALLALTRAKKIGPLSEL